MSPTGPAPAPPGPDAVRVFAVHLGGVRALDAGQRDLELRISAVGVQIYRLDTRAQVGTLPWSEIRSFQLPRRLSLRGGPPRIRLTTTAGEARFTLPGLTRRQLRDHLAPLVAAYSPGSRAPDSPPPG